MLKQKYFLADIFILSAEKQPIKLSWRKIVWLLYSHILLFCIGYTETSLLTDFLRGFYLNTFFFISGFLSYKANWDFSTTRNFLKKKIATLLIPTLFCLGVFCFFMRINYMTSLLDANKSGYWFTFTLFEMFSLYAIHSYITNTIKNIKQAF